MNFQGVGKVRGRCGVSHLPPSTVPLNGKHYSKKCSSLLRKEKLGLFSAVSRASDPLAIPGVSAPTFPLLL